MPVMNGLDAALQIKRYEDLSNPPRIVMVTAASRTLDDEPEERLAAVETVLTKPVNASMLLDALMFAIEGDDSARDRRRRRVGAIDERKLYPIRGASILLVEDNEINQEVALEFLKLGQFKVDIANNGVQCLERLSERITTCVDGYPHARNGWVRSHSPDTRDAALCRFARASDDSKCHGR